MSVRPTLLLIDRHSIAEGRIEHNNVSRDPDWPFRPDHENLYNIVSSRGKVIEQISRRSDNHIDKLAKKYLGHNKYTPDERRVILVQPETAQLIMYHVA